MSSEDYAFYTVMFCFVAMYILLTFSADALCRMLELSRLTRDYKQVNLILELHRFYHEYMARMALLRRFELSTSLVLFIEFQHGDPRDLPKLSLPYSGYTVFRARDQLREQVTDWILKETKICRCLKHRCSRRKYFKYNQRLSELLIVLEAIEDFIHVNSLSPAQAEILEYFTVGRIAPSLLEPCKNNHLALSDNCVPYLEKLDSIYSGFSSKPILADPF